MISGFLFTAIPNWTGRMPVRGRPLAVLGLLWIAGRLAMAGIGGFGAGVVMLIDCSFLIAISGMVAVEIIAGRNWRNLKILMPVVLLLITNILFHTEVLLHGSATYGRRLGIAVVLFLIMLIGGRIIPSFTRNWLVKSNPGRLPVPAGRFDVLCLATSGTALLIWALAPAMPMTGPALIGVAFLNLVRLIRWRGYRTFASPILLMLHVAFSFIPVGLFTLGIGAVAGMTLAVMIRATIGHTGRDLQSGYWLSGGFVLLVLAACFRSFLPHVQIGGLSGLNIAAGLWTMGFGVVLVKIGPWLLTANLRRRAAN